MTTERITNGNFCDAFTGWGYTPEDDYWYIYCGPGEWIDGTQCAYLGYGAMEHMHDSAGVWQSVDLTNVDILSFEAHIYLYTEEGDTPFFQVEIDGTPVYTIRSGFNVTISPNIDVSAFSGTHTVAFMMHPEGVGSMMFLHLISALASDVPPPPVAAFEAFPTSGNKPLTVLFTDESTGTPTSWLWDFGDGHLSAERHPTHIYEEAGTFTVDLLATNAGGSDMESKTDYITVNEPPAPPPYVEPIWSFKIGPT